MEWDKTRLFWGWDEAKHREVRGRVSLHVKGGHMVGRLCIAPVLFIMGRTFRSDCVRKWAGKTTAMGELLPHPSSLCTLTLAEGKTGHLLHTCKVMTLVLYAWLTLWWGERGPLPLSLLSSKRARLSHCTVLPKWFPTYTPPLPMW